MGRMAMRSPPPDDSPSHLFLSQRCQSYPALLTNTVRHRTKINRGWLFYSATITVISGIKAGDCRPLSTAHRIATVNILFIYFRLLCAAIIQSNNNKGVAEYRQSRLPLVGKGNDNPRRFQMAITYPGPEVSAHR